MQVLDFVPPDNFSDWQFAFSPFVLRPLNFHFTPDMIAVKMYLTAWSITTAYTGGNKLLTAL